MTHNEIAALEMRISEKLEPEPTFKLGLRDGRDLRSDGLCWWMEEHHLLPDGTIEFPTRSLHPRSWVRDEIANAKLRDTLIQSCRVDKIMNHFRSMEHTLLTVAEKWRWSVCLAVDVWLRERK